MKIREKKIEELKRIKKLLIVFIIISFPIASYAIDDVWGTMGINDASSNNAPSNTIHNIYDNPTSTINEQIPQVETEKTKFEQLQHYFCYNFRCQSFSKIYNLSSRKLLFRLEL